MCGGMRTHRAALRRRPAYLCGYAARVAAPRFCAMLFCAQVPRDLLRGACPYILHHRYGRLYVNAVSAINTRIFFRVPGYFAKAPEHRGGISVTP